MDLPERAPSKSVRAPESPDERFGPPASFLFRSAAAAALLSLLLQVFATALPGSRSGIDWMIPKSYAVAGVLTQLAVLLGCAELVLLVVATLADAALPILYRAAVVPAAAAVLMLVMLAARLELEAPASLALGGSAVALSVAASIQALAAPRTRAIGFVLVAVAASAVAELAGRAIGHGAHPDEARLDWLSMTAHVFDVVAVFAGAARLILEHGRRARVVVLGIFAASLVLSWVGIRGGFEGASTWQVLLSRSLGDLAVDIPTRGTIGSRYSIEAFAVLLGGAIVVAPRSVSLGSLAVALLVLARKGVDVPASALVLSLGALTAPLGGRRPLLALRGRPLPEAVGATERAGEA